MISIKCSNGHVAHTHDSVTAVRACYTGASPIVAAVAASSPKDVAKAKIAAAAKGATQPPASEKQVAFIQRLTDERYPGSDTTPDFLRATVARTKAEASATIEKLLAMPKATPATHPDSKVVHSDAPEGMHKFGDEILKVQVAVHGSGKKYAKRLVPGEGFGAKATFVYAPGMVGKLSADTLMTLEEAKAWGALYGSCCKCGRTLTDEGSIEAGIGPVCASKGEWA